MNRGELQLALRALQARKVREEARLAKSKKVAALAATRQANAAKKANILKAETRVMVNNKLGQNNMPSKSAAAPKLSNDHNNNNNNDPPKPNTLSPPPTNDEAEQEKQAASSNTRRLSIDEEYNKLLAEAAADDRARDVAVHGLTLRQLYQLKKDADAWNLVFKKKISDQEAADKAKKKKVHDGQLAMSKYYSTQVALKHEEMGKVKAEKKVWAQVIQKSIDEYKKEQEDAHIAKIEKNVHYREEFRKDIQRIRQLRLRERQKKIAAEQKELAIAKKAAELEVFQLKKKKEANFERMKKHQEEVKWQMLERAANKKRDEEEVLKLEKEYIEGLDKKDRDRHAAFQKIVAKQAAKEGFFTETTQDAIKRQLKADEERAEKYRQEIYNAQELKAKNDIARRKANTVAQLKSLELEKKIQAERKKKFKEEEMAIAKEMLARDRAALEADKEKQRAAKKKLLDYSKLLEIQIAQHQDAEQKRMIGAVAPNEMALNIALFKEVGYLPNEFEPPHYLANKKKK